MPTTIKLRNSVTTTSAPSSLVQGEVAINITDKKVWVGNAATTPIQLLGDGGSGSFTSIAFGAGTVSSPSITFTGDTNTGIYSPAADTIAFTEGGVESMRIDSSGNVGIGTNSPTDRLVVSTGAYTIGKIESTLASSSRAYWQFNAKDTSAASMEAYVGWFGDGLNTFDVRTGTSHPIRFATNNTERMRIDSSGNVGIGTSSPTVRLQTNGAVAIQGTAAFPSSGAGIELYYDTTNGSHMQSYDRTASAWKDLRLNSGLTVFSTAGSERMRITSGGNVGIGTSSPSSGASFLTVTELYGATNCSYAINAAGSHRADFGISSSGGWLGTNTNTDMRFVTNNTERMRITSGGNVGIGTNNPVYPLQVSAGSSGSIAFMVNPSGLTNFAVIPSNSGSTGTQIGTTGGDTFAFITNNAERMRINSSGYLLINTTTLNNGAQINVYGNNTTNGTYEWASPKGTNNSHMHYGTYGDWYIRPANNSGKVYVLNYQAESDERLKKDIAPINYGLAEIQQLQPRQFRWKNGDDSEVNGFIAQEVEEVLPALVSEGQWKSVDYQGITAILVKAIQEQQAMIEELKQEVAKLKGV